MSSSNEYLRHSSSVAAAVAAAMFAVAPAIHADTVTLEPLAGTTTNVLALYTGDTAVEIAGPGTVRLNPSNAHTGGTTLSGGTLEISGDFDGTRSPVGSGTFTIAGGTLRGSGTFGGNITGTGGFNIEAPDGWTLSGNHSFGAPVTLADGSLTVADGSMTFSDNLWLGVESSDVSFTMTGGSITMGSKNPQFSPKQYAKSRVTMTGGGWNIANKRIIVGYQTTYATNVTDISGTAAVTNSEYCYVYAGAGNFWSLNVHDGGLFATRGGLYPNGSGAALDVDVSDGGVLAVSELYNKSGSTVSLCVNGGILRNDKKGSNATSYYQWIGGNDSNTGRRLSSFTIGPKGATFLTENGDAAGVAQIYSPITAKPAAAGETAAGVTISGGRFAYYITTVYEGPTVIKNGATLYLPSNGAIPSGSAVTVESGSMLRLQGADKTISSLTLEEGAALGFGTPSSGANSALLTVSGSVTLPSQAQIALYTLATPAGVAKDANGTYAVLKVPAASAAALRAVRWSCATIADGKSATFAVTESGGTATLSVTIADSDAATTSGDITVSPGEFVSLSSSLDVGSRTVTVDGGWLKTSASLTGTGTGGQVIVENGGLLDIWNYVRFSSAANARYDLYVRNGGIVRAQLFSPQDTYKAYVDGALHIDGGALQLVFQKEGTGDNYKNPNIVSTYIGAGGATFDLSHWNDKGRTGWLRFVGENLKFYQDPNCDGADGGITVCGSNGDPVLYYFKSIDSASTMNGGITVADGGVISTVGGLADQTVRVRPGGMFRGYSATSIATIKSLVLGEANATKPAEIVVCRNSSVPTIVVTDTLSVLSPVTVNVAQGWNYDASIASGVYTALVYQASCSVDPSLFQLPAGCAGTLSAETITLTEGTYAGSTALVVTIDNAIAVTGSTSYPTPKTVSSDASCDSIVVGGAWNGEAAPADDTSLTISGNVTASTALYMGYNPAAGEDADDMHQGTLTIEDGASLSVPVVYSAFRSANNSQNVPRYGSEIYVNGGLLDVSGNVRFGNHWSRYGAKIYSRLTVNGGRVSVGGTFYLSYWNNNGGNRTMPGCIVLNDGEVDVKGKIDLSCNKVEGNDILSYENCFGVFLNGGVLKAENIMMTTNATKPKVVFNGGTYIPYGAAAANRTMQDLSKAYVSTNGAVISTANIPAGETYTIAQPLLTDPALGGDADGGLTKKGAGTLALTGVNTFTGPTIIEKGTLSITNAAALSASIEVADGAALDANGGTLSVGTIAASGAVVNGSLTVTNAIALAGEGSILSVDGDLTLANGAAIDFAVFGENVPTGWTPVAVASGTITRPQTLRARNAGDGKTRCEMAIIDGVLYVMPTSAGFTIVVK